jgi:hypothetical protein
MGNGRKASSSTSRASRILICPEAGLSSTQPEIFMEPARLAVTFVRAAGVGRFSSYRHPQHQEELGSNQHFIASPEARTGHIPCLACISIELVIYMERTKQAV